MQIKISFAAAYDFNQYTQYVPSPADFDPFPALPRIVGKGGFPAPPCRFLTLPLPAPPREKNSFPVHPCKKCLHLKMTFFWTIQFWLEQLCRDSLKNIIDHNNKQNSNAGKQLVFPLSELVLLT